jgi:molybdopterin molybdotransferase
MIPEEEALRHILDASDPLGSEQVALHEARGRFLTSDLVGKVALPGFDNSSMDGYALAARNDMGAHSAGTTFRVVDEQAAGPDLRFSLRAGTSETIRIFTGAPIPAGADAVVMQEEVRAENGVIILLTNVQQGENIRRRGDDLCEGQKIAFSGDPVTPQMASLLASQGVEKIPVGRAARVAILATGSELLPPGETLRAGSIYESNSVMLEMLTASAGANPTRLGIARDHQETLREKLAAGLEYDALIVSGGISVGKHDLVKGTLREFGVELELWRVAIKPGKPFLFGRRGSCRIFGLPGNPVSTFVTWLVFVRPALLKMSGARDWSLPRVNAITVNEIRNQSDRPHYIRGKFLDGKFATFGRQESHALFGLSQSNALLRVAAGETIPAETPVRVLLWN